jgi:2-polyprenyl-3-methyl-5-hydroxy-6-metoxy-1,4-benzoquinol methylase
VPGGDPLSGGYFVDSLDLHAPMMDLVSHTMLEAEDKGHIRTAPRPRCILCGCEGKIVYKNRQDKLFGAHGYWDFKKCLDTDCGLIWLDPMTLEEDIGKAYANYYTHSTGRSSDHTGYLRRIYRTMKRGYRAGKYGYKEAPPIQSFGNLLYLLPLSRGDADGEVRFLSSVAEGSLLDVGCGSGIWLSSMRDLGWQVEGVDFDEAAVEVARKQGLKVRHGALEQQDYPPETFDAVTLNHVIEHVPDPVGTLMECARILKRGGKLVLSTPNTASLGHTVFGEHWRGLEPPRHLHIFSESSLFRVLRLAGFHEVSFRPQIASSVIRESVLLRQDHSTPIATWTAGAFARLFNLMELGLILWKPSIADCFAAIAVKR